MGVSQKGRSTPFFEESSVQDWTGRLYSTPELIQGPGVLPNRGGGQVYIYIREIRKIG
jgi:hypothetical protein